MSKNRQKIGKRGTKRVIILSILLVTGYWLLATGLSGCATAPRRQIKEKMTLQGVDYVPLISLCQSEGIYWEWDTLAKAVTLSKADREIKLLVGSSVVLVDNEVKDIKYPVQLCQGVVVIPGSFACEIKDFFKAPPVTEDMHTGYSLKMLVIDPGHGGDDPGAIGNSGLREKDVVLDVACRLKQILERESIEVILTRDSDQFISLWKRSQIANSQDADLFISIHANASRSKNLQGFEIYYLSRETDDYARAQVAARNSAFAFEGEVGDNPPKESKVNLWNMIFSRNRKESIELAKEICSAVVREVEVKTKRIKGAPFYVLKKTQMPSILIEIGYLSNYSDEAQIKNSFYRQRLVEAIALGIFEYRKKFRKTSISR